MAPQIVWKSVYHDRESVYMGSLAANKAVFKTYRLGEAAMGPALFVFEDLFTAVNFNAIQPTRTLLMCETHSPLYTLRENTVLTGEYTHAEWQQWVLWTKHTEGVERPWRVETLQPAYWHWWTTNTRLVDTLRPIRYFVPEFDGDYPRTEQDMPCP